MIEKSIISLKGVKSNVSVLDKQNSAAEALNYDQQVKKIYQIRTSLLNEVENQLKDIIDGLNRNYKVNKISNFKVINKLELKSQIKYLKFSNADFQSLHKSQLDLIKVTVRNDWTAFKRLYYFKFMTVYTRIIQWPFREVNYLYLKKDYFLVHFKEEFVLLNQYFENIKIIKLRKNYLLRSINMAKDNQIVAMVSKDAIEFSHVFVFDFNLNLQRFKKLTTKRIKFCYTNFFYEYTPLFNNKIKIKTDWIIKITDYMT